MKHPEQTVDCQHKEWGSICPLQNNIHPDGLNLSDSTGKNQYSAQRNRSDCPALFYNTPAVSHYSH
jgi:hypothetical protein